MSSEYEKLYRRWHQLQNMVGTLTKAFILGCGKSGTTWLMNILNGHDEVVIRGEGCFAYKLIPAMQGAFEFFNNHQKQFDKPECTRLQMIDQVFLCRTAIDSLLVRYIQDAKRDTMQLRVVGDKTPQHAATLDVLSQVYPDGRFIQIVRDPRDVAVSAWFHDGVNGNRKFDEFITYFMNTVWPLHLSTAKRVAPSLGDRYLEFRYEDLHREEPEVVRKALKHLGVDASEAAVNKCIENGKFEKQSSGRARGQEDGQSFFRKGVYGDWVNKIPYELAQRCCDAIADLMISCGYDPSCRESMKKTG